MFLRKLRRQPAPIEIYCGQRKLADAPTMRWAMHFCYNAPKGDDIRVYQGGRVLWTSKKT